MSKSLAFSIIYFLCTLVSCALQETRVPLPPNVVHYHLSKLNKEKLDKEKIENSYVYSFTTIDSIANNNFDTTFNSVNIFPYQMYSINTLPEDSFYIRYALLKSQSVFSEYQEIIDSNLQRMLYFYADLLKQVFINENFFIYDDLDIRRIYQEISFGNMEPELQYIPTIGHKYEDEKAEDINKKTDSDLSFLKKNATTTLSLKELKSIYLFRCKNCLLWRKFIHLYAAETRDSTFHKICTHNQCKF